MADFSHLGVVCEEWIDLTRSNPPPPTPGVLQDDSQTRELQKKINLQRLNACQKELNIIKDCAINIRTVAIPTIDLHEIDARVYYPPLTASKRITKKTENAEKTPVLLYFHGGGFFSGTLLSEDATCIRLACASGFTIVNVNYRHTPDWTSPTQFNDAWDARCWVLENHMELGIPALELYVAGTSTGACLAAGLVVKERLLNQPTIRGHALWCPWLCLPDRFPYHEIISLNKASPIQCQDADLLPFQFVLQFANLLKVNDEGQDDAVINPLLLDRTTIKHLPPCHLMVCGNDPLRDHALLYKQKLDQDGIATSLDTFPGLPHGFRRIEGLKSNTEWDRCEENGLLWLLKQSGN